MKSGVLWSSNWFLGIRLIISNNINYGLQWNLGYSIMIYAQGRVGSEDILVSLTWRHLGEQQKVDDLKFVSITILCGALLDLHFLCGAFWVVSMVLKIELGIEQFFFFKFPVQPQFLPCFWLVLGVLIGLDWLPIQPVGPAGPVWFLKLWL